LGEPGCVPPWPRVNDIMYCCMDWKQLLNVELVVIRQVILLRHLRNEGIGDTMDDIDDNEPYTSHVWVNVLKLQNRERGDYRSLTTRTRCSWTYLLGHVVECGIPMDYDRVHHVPRRWEGIRVVPNYSRGILRY
jgi:hypothetical protein